jgi:hypothetical protein
VAVSTPRVCRNSDFCFGLLISNRSILFAGPNLTVSLHYLTKVELAYRIVAQID